MHKLSIDISEYSALLNIVSGVKYHCIAIVAICNVRYKLLGCFIP